MSDWIEGSPQGLRSRELANAKAEIERLKDKVSDLMTEIGRHCKTMDDQQRLITELADALQRLSGYVHLTREEADLIRRARGYA